VLPEKATELSVEVEEIANMVVINPFDFFVEEFAEKFPFAYPESQLKQLDPYLEITEDWPLLQAWMQSVDRSPKPIVDFLVYINQRLNKDINYTVRMEVGVQSCETTLSTRWGSCRDSAWLLVQVLRHLGFAARFVSGYLVQLTTDVKSLDAPSD
jgi:transglutaminase-like putative cysteine protease